MFSEKETNYQLFILVISVAGLAAVRVTSGNPMIVGPQVTLAPVTNEIELI